MRIAVVGTGIAGLACADALVAAGHKVVCFDKGRGPGGRMSTRRAESDGRSLQFDHGAQYFTVRDTDFVDQVRRWEAVGVAVRWLEAGDDAWVGTPGMNAPVRALAEHQSVHWGRSIEALRREEGGWVAVGSGDPGAFDAAIVAVPAEQAGPLLAPHRQDFADLAAGTPSQPSWTAMAAFSQRLSTEQDIVRDRGALGWAARDSAKPGRGGLESWVIQASADWSAQHLEQAPEKVATVLLGLLASELGVPLPAPVYLHAHRWRFARSGRSGEPTALWDASIQLGACGDWLAAPRVEAAWLSGRRAAALIGEAVKVNGSEGR